MVGFLDGIRRCLLQADYFTMHKALSDSIGRPVVAGLKSDAELNVVSLSP